MNEGKKKKKIRFQNENSESGLWRESQVKISFSLQKISEAFSLVSSVHIRTAYFPQKQIRFHQ
jgi:hypothetical protein